VLVLGGPGSGTTEQCARLAAQKGCVHLSIETLMRTAVREETETGRAISELVKTGKIVPAHLYLALLKAAMLAQPGVACLVDGFPKSLDNLVLLEEQVGRPSAPQRRTCRVPTLHAAWPSACVLTPPPAGIRARAANHQASL